MRNDKEPVGYISKQTLAELLHDNSGEYKIIVPHDLMSGDHVPIYVAADAHPGATSAPETHWIEWNGGEMPVDPGTEVEVRSRTGKENIALAGSGYATRWTYDGPNDGRDDIVAYRLRTHAPSDHVELTDTLVEQCDICAKPLNPDDICATDIELGICHAECLEGSPVVNLDTGEPLPDSELHTYRFGDTEKVERRITHLEAALAAEEERSKQLLVRLDKAREGKEPDFCYDPDEWEYTCDWEERDQVHGYGDALSVAEPMQVATLIRGPRKWVAKVPTSWDENGDPDDTEIKWFDSEEAARAALAAPASEGSTDA